MTAPYRIRTERLVLRCWSPADARLLKAAIDDNLEHLRAWEAWAMTEPTSLDGIVQRLRKFRAQFDTDEDYTYAIFDPDETAVVGGTGLHRRSGDTVEIGYWLDKGHTGRGLATEAATAMTRVAFELHKVHRVEIRCDPQNHRSAAVPARLGYTREAILRQQSRTPTGQPRDTLVWSMLAPEYPASRAARVSLTAQSAAGATLCDKSLQ